MGDLESLKGEFERERRGLAMLSPNAPITPEKAIDLIRDAKQQSPPHKPILKRAFELACRPMVAASKSNASLPWLSDKPTLDELVRRPRWQQHAACRGVGPSAFFASRPVNTSSAKALCDACTVREECGSYAADTGSSAIWATEQKPRTGLVVSIGHTNS